MFNQPELGQVVRLHRKKSGLSQLELAQLVGVGKTVIYDLEKGKDSIQLKTLLKILNGLNIKVKLVGPFIAKTDE